MEIEGEGRARHRQPAPVGRAAPSQARWLDAGLRSSSTTSTTRAAEETVRLIEGDGGRAAFVRADVTLEDEIGAAIRFADEHFGGLDILVNNAGGTPGPHFPDAPAEHWSRTLDLNLRGPMLAIQLALPAMRRRGGGRRRQHLVGRRHRLAAAQLARVLGRKGGARSH